MWRPASLPDVRLVIARCSVDYAGRLTAHLPVGHPADHGEGRRLRRHPRRRRRLQAAQLDERPEQGRRAATTGGSSPAPRARRSPSSSRRCSATRPTSSASTPACRRTASRPTCRSCWPPTPPPSAPGSAWCGGSTPPASARSTCCAAMPTASPSPSRSSAGARSTASSSSPATSTASTCDPLLRPVRGIFVAQVIKPQARTLADRPRHRLRRGRLRRAARHRVQRAAPVLRAAGPHPGRRPRTSAARSIPCRPAGDAHRFQFRRVQQYRAELLFTLSISCPAGFQVRMLM